MAGVKGRSGRRARSVDEKRLHTIDMAWERCGRLIADPNNKMGDIVAQQIASRTVPQGPLIDARVSNILVQIKELSASDTSTGNRITHQPIQSA